ncbi:hypothetical protein GCM10023187_51880 [Nibrella viscosa]|uniref:Thioredoxin domain-containing protein n=1 Tax=Nibrella viscosa TaxID=1084524 RepID=A0ABP8KX46_9BACT
MTLFLVKTLAQGQNFSVKGRIDYLSNQPVQLILLDEKRPPIKSQTDSKGNFEFSGTVGEPSRAGIAWGEPMKGIPFVLAPQVINIQTDTALSNPRILYSKNDLGKIYQEYQQFENQFLEAFKKLDGYRVEASYKNKQDSVAYYASEVNDLVTSSLSELRANLVSGRYQGLESFIAWQASSLIGWIDQFPFFTDLISLPLIKGIYKEKISDYLVHNQLAGQQTPTVNIIDSESKLYSLNSLNEKYLLIDFWASWCGPCIAQLPSLKDLYTTYSNKLAIVSISIDEDKEKWRKALLKHPTKWIQCLDKDQSQSLKTFFKVEGIPDYILVAPGGKIIDTHLTIPAVIDALNKP